MWTDTTAGDLRPAPDDGAARLIAFARSCVPSRPTVHWMDQVHGGAVASAEEASGEPEADAVGEGPVDALVAVAPTVALAVLTADCAAVALASPEGHFGAVHAGWRGVRAGVLEATVAALGTPRRVLGDRAARTVHPALLLRVLRRGPRIGRRRGSGRRSGARRATVGTPSTFRPR